MAKDRHREGIERRARRREGSGPRMLDRTLASWRTVVGLLGVTALVVVVAFAGLAVTGPLLREGSLSRLRVVAEVPFVYESDLRTQVLRDEVRKRVSPVFRLELETYATFENALTQTLASLEDLTRGPGGDDVAPLALTQEDVARFLQSSPSLADFGFDPDDLALVVDALDRAGEDPAVAKGLADLRALYETGIYEPDEDALGERGAAFGFLNVRRADGQMSRAELRTPAQALTRLNVNLAVADASGVPIVPHEVRGPLFRLLREGLRPNLAFDDAATAALIARAEAEVEPVRVAVRAGDTIIEPNTPVNAFALEQLQAYRTELTQVDSRGLGWDGLLIERALFSLVLLLGAWVFLKLVRMRMSLKPRTLLFAALVLVINLGTFRFWLEIAGSEAGDQNPLLGALAPFLMPVAWGPMIITILLGATPGLLFSGLIAVFFAMMQGNSLALMVGSLLTGLVAIDHCRNIQVRARVVRAGFFSGLVMAVAAVFLGLREGLEPITILWQVLAAVGTGFVTGTVVVGLLPVFESLFRTTTDITMLELTDFNHPLLRRMQVEAPGSYHHSLMVANLAEHAASRVGANSLVCRVCGLFHDIGKMVKPEYFTENQRDGHNPHLERNPSMSALIIKAHVKEGVQMAKHARLPQVVVDAIREHHGTSLIQYFYYKAIEEQKASAETSHHGGASAPSIELDRVNEETYRYEGPRPHTTEQAILMLADSVEAAGRSLRKVTPQSVEELVESIIQSRLRDGQLDDAPVTLAQLATIRESFIFSLLNVLHSRVEYPKEAGEKAKKRAKKGARDTTASPFAAAAERMAREAGATKPAFDGPEESTSPAMSTSDAER